jgi:putative toxin-antitoxin system antitoxin component (TIGR02293 family)
VALLAPKKLNECLQEWLGTSARSELTLVLLVEAGLPTSAVDRLVERGLSKDEVSRAVIDPRALKRRSAKRKPLSPIESERAVRIVRVIWRAQSVLGDELKALA